MLTLVTPIVFVGPNIFDQSISAFRARKAFSVAISLDATLNKSTTVGRYVLDFSPPSKVLFKKMVGGKPSLVFWLNGSKVTAYDPASNEYAVRKAPFNGPLVNRLANVVGGIEDPVAAQLSPQTMAAFLSPFKALTGWATTRSGSTIRMERSSLVNGKRAQTLFEFAADSKLLTKAVLLGPTSRLQWLFEYRKPSRALAYTPPHGSALVSSLTEHTDIHATDPRTRAVIDQSLRAYSRISSLAFTASGTAGRTTNFVNGSSFRAQQGQIEWSYTAGVLTIKDQQARKSYRGACKPTAILTYLKRLHSPVEPVLHSLLLHQNPISGWFLPSATASTKGAVKIGAVTADVIELKSNLIDISLLIRSDNHLVASVSSRTKDDRGRVVSEAEREFTYTSVGKPLPANTFKIAVSSPLPLSAIPK